MTASRAWALSLLVAACEPAKTPDDSGDVGGDDSHADDTGGGALGVASSHDAARLEGTRTLPFNSARTTSAPQENDADLARPRPVLGFLMPIDSVVHPAQSAAKTSAP